MGVAFESASVVSGFAFQFFGEVFRLFKSRAVARNGIAAICPCPKIDRLASFAAKRAELVVLKGGFFSAAGTFDLLCHSFLELKPRHARSVFNGAGDRVRTDDVQLGKLTFYH